MLTVKELKEKLQLKVFAGNCESLKKINGCYIGDLLSFVLAKGKKGNVWLTVIGNVNAIAVCSLLDFSCMILTDDSLLDEEAKNKANEKDIVVFSTNESSFKISLKIAEFLKL